MKSCGDFNSLKEEWTRGEKGTFLREHNEKGINFDISSIQFRVRFAILCSSIGTTLASGSALPGIVIQIRVNGLLRDCVRQKNFTSEHGGKPCQVCKNIRIFHGC